MGLTFPWWQGVPGSGRRVCSPCFLAREAARLHSRPENRHRGFLTFWHALRRLLPLLAVLSLALTPVIASAAAAGMASSMTAQAATSHEAMPGMDHAGMANMDDMPCCPPENPAKPDCAKAGYPLMALCLASGASPDAGSFASLHGPPLPEPP